MFCDIPITSITREDILQLVDPGEVEGQHLDFKKAMPLDQEGSRDDYRKDVTAFANASGGDIVVGICDAKAGKVGKDRVVGIAKTVYEGLEKRWMQLLRGRVSPQIPGVAVQPVTWDDDRYVVVLRIPRSPCAPHEVVRECRPHNGEREFWMRKGADKAPMDVGELRDAFSAAGNYANRMRQFRYGRLKSIVDGDPIVAMDAGPKIVYHSMPAGMFYPGTNHDVRLVPPNMFHDLGCATHPRYNVDGLLLRPDHSHIQRYAQVYRNGAVEAVHVARWLDEGHILGAFGDLLAADVHCMFGVLLEAQAKLGVVGAVFLAISVIGCAGKGVCEMGESYRFDREVVAIPEEMVDICGQTPTTQIDQMLDIVWQSSGHEKCPRQTVPTDTSEA